MSIWLGAITAALSFLSQIWGYFSKKSLMNAGAAKVNNRNLSRALKNIEKARAARRAVDDEPDSLSDDGYRRD